MAKLLRGFDVNIFYNDIKEFSNFEDELNIKKLSFEELLKISDIVSVHVPCQMKLKVCSVLKNLD